MENTIDLYLISGFLGAGKTSFLQSVLKDLPGRRVGVIVNDFGSVGIDGAVLKTEELKLVEINNGSIFCACLKGGFIRTLALFLEQPVDYLFVEASGLADPDNMGVYLDQVEAIVSKKPQVTRRYTYRGGICVVDAVNYTDLSDVFPVLESQVRKSRFLLINKSSDIPKDDLEDLKADLAKVNPEAYQYTTDYGRVDPEILDAHIMADKETGETLNTPWNRPVTYVLAISGGDLPDMEDVSAFCGEIAPLTLRVKGFMEVKEGLCHIDCVGPGISVACESALSEKASVKAKQNKIVLIGREELLTEEKIRRAWNSSFKAEAELIKE